MENMRKVERKPKTPLTKKRIKRLVGSIELVQERLIDFMKNPDYTTEAKIDAIENMQELIESFSQVDRHIYRFVADWFDIIIHTDNPKSLRIALLDCCATFTNVSKPNTLNLLHWAYAVVELDKHGEQTDKIKYEMVILEPKAKKYDVTLSFVKFVTSILNDLVSKPEMDEDIHFYRDRYDKLIDFILKDILGKFRRRRRFVEPSQKTNILSYCQTCSNYNNELTNRLI